MTQIKFSHLLDITLMDHFTKSSSTKQMTILLVILRGDLRKKLIRFISFYPTIETKQQIMGRKTIFN